MNSVTCHIVTLFVCLFLGAGLNLKETEIERKYKLLPVLFRFRLALPRDVATPPDPLMTWVTRNRHFPSDLELVKCSVVNVPPINDPLPLTTRDRSLLCANELVTVIFLSFVL